MSESAVTKKLKHKRWQPNQIHRELMGVLSLSSFDPFNSASRKQMFSSHIAQSLVIKGSTERRIQSGMEREYGKFTFATKFPVDAEVIKTIQRYPQTIDISGIKHNPETLVIYEDANTKEVGCLSLTDFYSNHPYFGFELKRTKELSRVKKGEAFREGTILQDSPSINETGGYQYGRECNVAFMSHPAVAEDGIMICRDVLEHFTTKIYERRVVEWGSRQYPLNLYGDENIYKPHPDIGDYVRDDGLIMALRSEEPDFAPVEQSINATMEFDNCFNNLVYAGRRGGRVKDIRVMHDSVSAIPTTLIGMDVQTDRYDVARRRYYQEIHDEYERLRRARGGKINLSKEFHRLVVEAISVIGNTRGKPLTGNEERVTKLYRGIPLDDWRVEFVIEYDVVPTIGFKLTDTHGGKGVICHIAERHEMPTDAAGNSADMVMDPNARNSRMNLGGLYEPYINANMRDTLVTFRNLLGLENKGQNVDIQYLKNHPQYEFVKSRLLRWYEVVIPGTHELFVSGQYKDFSKHLAYTLKNGHYIEFPPDNDPEGPQIVRELEAEFPSVYGPVTFIGNSGLRRVTKAKVRIGSMYIIMLDKIGDDRTAVSSSKLQNFGVLAPITSRDKHASPIRRQAIRAFGETEVRILTATIGPEKMAELLDRNNNILTHREGLDTILEADKPTNIAHFVDRSKNPLGNARPLQLVKHLGFCGGWRFAFKPFVPHLKNDLAEVE